VTAATPVPVRTLTLHQADVRVYSAPGALCSAAAEDFFQLVIATLAKKPGCNVSLSGGSTPKSLYALIAQRAAEDDALRGINWHRIHFFFGDERCVPPTHADSNYRMVRETLLSRGTFPEANVHRIQTELDPEVAAKQYEKELRDHFGGIPAFDLSWLGMGPDGHTASLFPGTSALQERNKLAVKNFVPKLDATRVTLTFPVFSAARKVQFLVTGGDKAPMLKRVLVEGEDLPSGAIRPAGRLEWLLDVAAAAELGDR
jgi:6-phosphogluconolactonase